MSDIAMLVAEEYERRAKILRKEDGGGGAVGAREMDMVSWASVLAWRVKEKIGEEEKKLVKWVLEPKSQIGIAASNSFFSA